MNNKLLSLFLSLALSMCLASHYVEGSQTIVSRAELNEQCISAAMRGPTDQMVDLLRAGADVNAYNRRGFTALYWASRGGHVICVKALIEAKADVNACYDFNTTALYAAATQGHTGCVQYLIGAKANVNVRNIEGETPLYCAAEKGYTDCVKALIEAKAEVNVCNNDGTTPLHRAAEKGHTECVKALIRAKADCNARDGVGKTPIEWACAYAQSDCVKILVKYGNWFTASEEQVFQSRRRIFNILLQFVWLRNRHPELTNLSAESLQFEILSRNKLLQDDLVIIFLDELKKGSEIKGVALIRSKEAAVCFLLKKFEEITSGLPSLRRYSIDLLLQPSTREELIREGLNERCKELKVKKTE